MPLPHSICQHAMLSRMPLVIEDARAAPGRCAICRRRRTLDVVGYLGVPLLSASAARRAGTLCAIDSRAAGLGRSRRSRSLEDLAATVIAYLERTPERAGRGGGRASTSPRWRSAPASAPTRCASGSGATASCAPTGRAEASAATTSETWLASSGCATGSPTDCGSARPPRCSPTTRRRRPSSTSGLRDAIVAAVSDPDPRQLTALVEQVFTLHDVETAVEEIVAPGAAHGRRPLAGRRRVHRRGAPAERGGSLAPARAARRPAPPRQRHGRARVRAGRAPRARAARARGAAPGGRVAPRLPRRRRTARVVARARRPHERRRRLPQRLDARPARRPAAPAREAQLPETTRVIVGGAAAEPPQRLGEVVAGLRPADERIRRRA